MQTHSTTPKQLPSIPARNLPAPRADPAPLGTPSYSHKQAGRQSLTVAVGGPYAKLRFAKPEAPGQRHWVRGDVQAFTARSRSRLLQSFAKMDTRAIPGYPLFVTLTYHHEWSEIGCEWKLDLKEWERRIRRRYPHAFMYWRLELQRRGAPHFHCLVFGLDESAAAFIRETWLDVAEACCRWCHLYMARVDTVKSWDQVRRYCSKYCAKVETVKPERPGRYWGILNRSQRKEQLHTVDVTEQEAFRLRRIFKRLIRAANGYYKPGGSRSGVWVRCSNETAKRALAYVANALRDPGEGNVTRMVGPPYDDDRRGPDTCWSNTAAGARRVSRKIVRIPDNASGALFDDHDCQAARARALF